MGKFFKKHFSLRALGLGHHKPNDFAVSSWQRSNSAVPMLAVRLVLAAVATGVFLWSLLEGTVTGFWFIYLTNWGLMMISASTCGAVVVSLAALCSHFPDKDSTPWFVSCYWLLYNITVPMAFLITVFYWSILYESDPEVGWYQFSLDLATHGGNSAVMLLELLVSRTPSRLLHFYQPFGFGVWYAVFSAIYYGAGGLNEHGVWYVYEVLDWSQPGRAMGVVGGTAAGLLALHALVTCTAALRTSASTACARRKGHDLPSLPPQPRRAAPV